MRIWMTSPSVLRAGGRAPASIAQYLEPRAPEHRQHHWRKTMIGNLAGTIRARHFCHARGGGRNRRRGEIKASDEYRDAGFAHRVIGRA